MTDAQGAIVQDFFELPNGCVCCSVKEDLVSTLDFLLEARRFDLILVETTGIADPEKLAEIFWVDEGSDSKVFLDGIVTVVDALNILSHLSDSDPSQSTLDLADEATKQIACADRIILNKLDLAGEDHAGTVEARLRDLNPSAPLTRCYHSKIDLAFLLNMNALGHDPRELHISESAPHKHRTPGHHSVEHVVLRPKSAVLCKHALDKMMASVLWEGVAGKIFRCKGVFLSDGVACVLQGVGNLFEVCEAPAADVSSIEAKFLFIGHGLKVEVLIEMLDACDQP